MSDITITLTISIPDGATVAVGPSVTLAKPASVAPSSGDRCPEHNVPWKHVPGGVSKRTGKAYSAFWACPENGCKHKPPADYSPPTAAAPDDPMGDFEWPE